MGMSSSQARLLNLTGRLHDIEYKAAKLEAQKLQMANESRHVYENYLNALEAKKVQYKFINSNGSFGYRDATLASLENGGLDSYNGHTSSQTYLLQDSETGLIYVTPEFAAKYGITNSSGVEKVTTLQAYINDHKSEIPTRPVMRDVEDYSKLLSATPAECRLVTQFNPNPQEYYPNVTLATGIGRTIEKTPGYITNGVQPTIDTTPTTETANYITINNFKSKTECVASSMNSVNTKSEYVINNQHYNYTSPIIYTFSETDLNRNFGNWSFSVHTKYIDENFKYNEYKPSGYYSEENYGVGENLKIRDFVQHLADTYEGCSYDATTRTLTVYGLNDNPVRFGSGVYSGSKSVGDVFNDSKQPSTTSSTPLDIENTKISDYVLSTGNSGTITINGTPIKYTGPLDINEITFKQYFDWIKSNGIGSSNLADFNYSVEADGIHVTTKQSYPLTGIQGLSGNIYNLTEKNYNCRLYFGSIAQNIILAMGICNFDNGFDIGGNAGAKQMTVEEYNELKSNNSSLPTELVNKFNNAQQWILVGKMSDELCDVLQAYKSNSNETNRNALIALTLKIKNFIKTGTYDTTSTAYDTTTTYGASSTKTVSSYSFNGTISSSTGSQSASVGSVTQPTGEVIPTVKINYSANDIKLMLAYEMYKDDPTVNPNNKVSEVEGILSNYLSGRTTDELLASLLTTYNSATTAEKTALIDRLKTNSLTTSDANLYDSYDDNYVQLGNTNLLTVSVPAGAKYEVECPAKKDMIIKLIDDIYHGNNNFVYDDMQAAYNKLNTLSDKELASIFSYYGTGDWNAIKGLVKTELEAATFDKTNLADYTKKATEHLSYNNSNAVVSNTAGNSIFTKHADSGTGSVKIPSIDNIATNLLIAFRTIDPNIKESDFKSMLTSRYGNGTNNNNITLELINRVCADYIKNYLQNNNTPDSDLQSKVQNILNHLKNGSSLNIADSNYQPYDSSKYNVSMESSTSISYRYDTKQEPTGQEELNTDSDEYKALVQKYYQLLALQDYEFEIKNDTNLTESSEYLSNLLIDGGFTLINFSGDIKNLPNTSVSVEPSLQEVPDETELRKAEAQYEADMHRIDRKDRMYDTQLAALDSERNAIKQEMETLKTVAKDNVERTFKLFG